MYGNEEDCKDQPGQMANISANIREAMLMACRKKEEEVEMRS